VFVVVKYKKCKNRSVLVNLPSAEEKAFGKVTICPSQLCCVPPGMALGKEFPKENSLPSASRDGTRQRIFKKKIVYRVPPGGHSAKNFQKKSNFFAE